VCVHGRRFYGGVKLGAGGLVRAYGGAARDCLRSAPKQHVTPKLTLRLQVRVHPVLWFWPGTRPCRSLPLLHAAGLGWLQQLPSPALPAHNLPTLPPSLLHTSTLAQVPFELLGAVYPLLEQHGAQKQEESYDDTAGVALVVACEAGRAEALRGAIADATSGRVLAETVTAAVAAE
jgi:hypothetical protein